MAKEVNVQADMVAAVKRMGGWGIKASNAFIGGIPDLDLIVPLSILGCELDLSIGNVIRMRGMTGVAMKIEVKLIEALPVRASDTIRFKHPLTPLQEQTMMGIRSAGGVAGWLAVYKTGRDTKIISGLGLKDIPTKENFEKCAQVKPYGTKWEQVLPKLLVSILDLCTAQKPQPK